MHPLYTTVSLKQIALGYGYFTIGLDAAVIGFYVL